MTRHLEHSSFLLGTSEQHEAMKFLQDLFLFWSILFLKNTL